MRGTRDELAELLEAEQTSAYAGGSTVGLSAHEIPGIIAEWLAAREEQLRDQVHDLHLRGGKLRDDQPCPVCSRRDDTPPLAGLVESRDRLEAARRDLDDAAARARAAGHSWQEIGDALGTSRQAAYERFSRAVQ